MDITSMLGKKSLETIDTRSQLFLSCNSYEFSVVNSCLLITSPITVKRKLVVSPAINHVVQSLAARLLRVDNIALLLVLSMHSPPP